jgi:uncharacterized RDD family membrane protein YckC
MEPVVPSVFDEMEGQRPVYFASTGQRFLNFIIDSAVFYVCFIIITFAWALFDQLLGINFTVNFFEDESLINKLLVYLYSYSIFFLVYTAFEGFTKGRTIAKYITKTKVVMEDGSPIGMKQAVMRSLCRLIPFEPFTAFNGNPLHDKATKTCVVKMG